MSGLSRPVSRSTELLHVSRQESSGGRRSWDSLLSERKKCPDSDVGSPTPDGTDVDPRSRLSIYSTTQSSVQSPSASTNVPWFGGLTEFRSGDQSATRLCGTIPRSILALTDRPTTYEEELEDRLGLLKVSATTLYQRLANEKKKTKELTQQLSLREQNHKGIVEKIRSQYDQRFERLKNRATLLVTRCEFLRNEKHLLEQRLAHAMESAAKERQTMERRVSSLQEEVERLKRERESADEELPILRVTEDTDGDAETKKKEEVRRECCFAKEQYKLLCEMAVARVARLEKMASRPRERKIHKDIHNLDLVSPSLLSRRSSSCPMIPVTFPGQHSFEEISAVDVSSRLDAGTLKSLSTSTESEKRAANVTVCPAVWKPLTNARSMPPTFGNPKSTRPSTIRHSLQKLFTGANKTSSYDPSAFPDAVLVPETRLTGVPARIATPSDDEFSGDIFHFEGKNKPYSKQPPVKNKGTAPPTPTKRHPSLPRVDLFRKFQSGSKLDKESQAFPSDFESRALSSNRNSVPMTKQERVLGIRINRSISHEASCTSFAPDVPATSFRGEADSDSTESLPDKVEESVEEKSKSIKRNRSLHSTFGRLHHRRNGMADIGGIEPKPLRSHSALDQLGKNLRHYLH